MELTRGSHLLRITLLTPANFGSTSGSPAIDRPISVDVFQELPYVPGSSLRGVLAGRKGNVRNETGGFNNSRTEVYGSPDDGLNPGVPSRVVLGDGEILCFPVPLDGGGMARVFAAAPLTKMIRIAGWTSSLLPPRLKHQEYLATFVLPGATTELRQSSATIDWQAISDLAGTDPSGNLIMAGREAAKVFWRKSSETRTLTAVDAMTGIVKDGSLRVIELIPAGTVFLSFVTVSSDTPLLLADDQLVQLGGWESTGFGYAWIENAAEPTGGGPIFVPTHGAASVESEVSVMKRVFQAVQGVGASEEAPVIYSLCRELGPRWGASGIGGALGFCLAKAKLAARPETGLSCETRAYRMFLQVLFRETDEGALMSRVQGVIKGHQQAPPAFEATLVWLSRYAEILLKPPKLTLR
ncbi:MAG: hypothetical protein HYX75_25630 [Acidobacteria bacterium]|nr:hypothetical protein [Acidobacteriota bacterium]